MYRLRFNNLFSPEDGNGTTPPSGPMDKTDVINFLGDDESIPLEETNDEPESDKTDKKSDKETKDTKGKKKTTDSDSDDDEESSEDESDDELKELEEELNEDEDVDEEKLELVTPVRRAQILKKYPQLFKDFPYLEKAYYRDRQFTELLPTIEDAQAAVEKAKTLDSFENDLLAGNTENMLAAAKQADQEAFHKIVDNYLPTLHKVDPNAYTHVIGNVVKQTIIAMVQESRASNNAELQTAAQLLNQFVFGRSTFEQPTSLAKPQAKNTEAEKLQERQRNFEKQQFQRTSSELYTKVNNSLKNTIEQNIDPTGRMTDYVKKTASRDAFESLEKLINNDRQFRVLVDKLWERAQKSDYSEEAIGKVRSAFIAKARTLLPSVIKKARLEALRGIGKRTNETKDKPENDRRRSTDKTETPRSNSGGKSKVPAGMSSLEYLMSED